MKMKNSIDIEKITVSKMIDLYCQTKHGNTNTCDECKVLKAYSNKKLDLCIYKNNKPVCRSCPKHCYASQQREHIKGIMKFSGPRLLFTNPILAIFHLYKLLKVKK